jgi:methionyl-tRNA synthetase
MREVPFGQDGNYSWESMVDRHNADLANGLGNLASRVLAMLGSYFDGAVPEPTAAGSEADLPAAVADAASRVDAALLGIDIAGGLSAVWTLVDRSNRYLVEKEPWKLAKDPAKREEVGSVLYAATETLRVLAILLQPIMPGASQRLWDQLGIGGDVADRRVPADVVWGLLKPGTKTTKGDALFPRLEADA